MAPSLGESTALLTNHSSSEKQPFDEECQLPYLFKHLHLFFFNQQLELGLPCTEPLLSNLGWLATI